MLVLALAAAGVFAAGGEEAATDVQKVVWWTSSLQTEYRPAIQELFLDPLAEAHPEVDLELVYMEDYYRTTQTAIQAGAGPDIIQLGGPGYALEYWSAGQLSDMSDLAAHYRWESRLLGWTYESGTSSDGSLITPADALRDAAAVLQRDLVREVRPATAGQPRRRGTGLQPRR